MKREPRYLILEEPDNTVIVDILGYGSVRITLTPPVSDGDEALIEAEITAMDGTLTTYAARVAKEEGD